MESIRAESGERMELERGRKTERKLFQWLLPLFVAGACLAAAVKVLFVGFTADEEYQLLLTYRLAKGDMLFREVWDTLQTSAFYGQFFTWIYLKIMHTTTGLLLWLRLCGILTQGAVSLFLYATLKRHLKRENALLLAGTFFCTYAKLVAMPEYSNLQSWSLVMMLCLLWRAMDCSPEGKNHGVKETRCVILAALCYCVAVLASACVILIPVIAILLVRMRKGGGMRRNLAFWGTCAAGGLAYVGMLLLTDGPRTLVLGIQGMLAGDDTHGSTLLNGSLKWSEYLRESGIICGCLVASLGAAYLISRMMARVGKGKRAELPMLWLGISYVVTLSQWFVKQTGYEGLKLHYPVLAILGLFSYFRTWQRDGSAFAEASPEENAAVHGSLLPAVYGIFMGVGVFGNVLFISNVSMICNVTFLGISALWGMVILAAQLERSATAFAPALSLFVISVLGTVLTLNFGPSGRTISDLRSGGRMQDGPARGTIVARQIANIYGLNEKAFREQVKEGSNVLVVTSFFHNRSLSTLYMLNDSRISHYTVNSTPTYGDQLYAFWEQHPDRWPDCIVINGDSCPAEDYQWAMELVSKYDEMEEIRLYDTQIFVRPECLK